MGIGGRVPPFYPDCTMNSPYHSQAQKPGGWHWDDHCVIYGDWTCDVRGTGAGPDLRPGAGWQGQVIRADDFIAQRGIRHSLESQTENTGHLRHHGFRTVTGSQRVASEGVFQQVCQSIQIRIGGLSRIHSVPSDASGSCRVEIRRINERERIAGGSDTPNTGAGESRLLDDDGCRVHVRQPGGGRDQGDRPCGF